jgi:hypothetical protein
MTGGIARSSGSIRSTISSETTELLGNENTAPLGRSPPSYSQLFASAPHSAPFTPNRLSVAANTNKDGSPRSSLLTPNYHTSSPERPRGGRMDPTLARRASMSLSPQMRPRRLSNASLVRSRSIADPVDGEGTFSRDRVLALLCVCVLSVGSHL